MSQNKQDESTTDKQSSEIIVEDNALFRDKVSLQNLNILILDNVNVESIWKSRLATMSCGIQNLTKLCVYNCMNLRWIFLSSTVSSFDRLKYLEIVGCPKLEEIIVVDKEELKNVTFPQLKELRMEDLEKLTSFCTGDVHIKFSSLQELRITKCPEFILKEVSLQNLNTLILQNVNVERIWQSTLATISCGIQNLIKLCLYSCMNLRWIFPSSTFTSFDQLKYLEIVGCPKLEEIIVVDQEELKNVMFPQLEELRMIALEKLTSLCKGDVHITFSSLKELSISECPEFILKEVFVFSNLEALSVDAKCIPWICQLPEDFFGKLKRIDVTLDESTSVSSLEDFFRKFHTIKILIIRGDSYHPLEDIAKENFENGLVAIIRHVNKFCDRKHILKHVTILKNLEKSYIQRGL